MLQQCLPLAVLKLKDVRSMPTWICKLQQCLPLAVLKLHSYDWVTLIIMVATVLTACGIETLDKSKEISLPFAELQQCLPLAVLKLLQVNTIFSYCSF